METGSSIDDVLALGRRLNDHFEDHDTIRHWMAHHLAYLIVAADDQSATLEQRKEIVDLILRVWSYRRQFPDGSPLQGFPAVFAAIEAIGDRSPWRLGRLVGSELVEPAAANAELIAHAVELENLTGEAVTSLLCLAAERARDLNEPWLTIANKVADNVETRVVRALERSRRRDQRLTLEEGLAPQGDVRDELQSGSESDLPSWTVGSEQHSPPTKPHSLATGTTLRLPSESQDIAIAARHVTRLREMANMLNRVADELSNSAEEELPGAVNRGSSEGTDGMASGGD